MIPASAPAAQPRAPTRPEGIEAFGIGGRMGAGLHRVFMARPPLEDGIDALKNAR